MVVNLSFGRPFHGVVFSEGEFANEECRWKGNGGHYLLNAGDRRGFCGLRFNDKTGKHSMRFIVSPDAMILTDESMALAAHCVQSVEDFMLTLQPPALESSIKVMRSESLTVSGNATGSPELGLRLLADHGLLGPVVGEGMVGKRLTLDAQLKDTSIFDMFVHDCIAHDGSRSEDASVNIVDANGCAVKLSRAVDEPVFVTPPQQNSSKHVYVHIYGFQFTSSELVHFECQ
ncbi:ZP domain-containing protein [Aphelenchoides fujianensis]|nr:ZP domain-containing protein [Aphelenchoides fujianensis]